MTKKPNPIVLLSEDDEDDYLLVQDAFREHCPKIDLRWVPDGIELMDYLLRKGAYAADAARAPMPDIILLDLNMPKKDGREALKELKSHPHLARIPVIVMTTSDNREDILYTYRLGSSSYIRKPHGYKELVEAMKIFCDYWFDLVKLPPRNGAQV